MNFPVATSGVTPNLFLVGMPRCGTTTLYAYLRRHPQVFTSWYKEIQYFGEDLQRHSRISAKAYAALFCAAGRYAWRLDASTTGMLSARAAEEIHAYNPEARVLIGLREPGAWLASMHGALVTWREEERPFAQALAVVATRVNCPRAGCLDYHQYWRNALALPQRVQRYRELFGERVFIYSVDELGDAAFYARLCAWLGVAPIAAQPEWDNARARLKYWRRIPDWLSGRARRKAVEALLDVAPVLAQPAYALYRPVRALLLRVMNGAPEVPPVQDYVLDAQQKAELLAMVQELERVCGRDFSGWKTRLSA